MRMPCSSLEESPKPNVEGRSPSRESVDKSSDAHLGSWPSGQLPFVGAVTGREREGDFSAAGLILHLDLGAGYTDAFRIQFVKMQ